MDPAFRSDIFLCLFPLLPEGFLENDLLGPVRILGPAALCPAGTTAAIFAPVPGGGHKLSVPHFCGLPPQMQLPALGAGEAVFFGVIFHVLNAAHLLAKLARLLLVIVSPCGSNPNGTDTAFVWDRVIALNISRNPSQSGIPVVFRVWATGEDIAFCDGELCLRTPPGWAARVAPGARCLLSSCCYSGYMVAAPTPPPFSCRGPIWPTSPSSSAYGPLSLSTGRVRSLQISLSRNVNNPYTHPSFQLLLYKIESGGV